MSGKYDPSSWAKQRNAAIARAQAIREERRRGEDVTTEHTFTPTTTPYPSYLKKTNSGRTTVGQNGDSLDQLAMQMPSPPRQQQHGGYGTVHNPHSPTDALSKHVNSMSLHELANSNTDDLDAFGGMGDESHSTFANLLRTDNPAPFKAQTQRVRSKPDWNMDTDSNGWGTDAYAPPPPNRSTKPKADKQDISKARSRLSLLKAKMTKKPSEENVFNGQTRQPRPQSGSEPSARSARSDFEREEMAPPQPRVRRTAGEQVARPRQPEAAKSTPYAAPATSSAWDETPPPRSAGRRPINQNSSFNTQAPDEYPSEQGGGDMEQCPDCMRRFNADAFEKHVKICQKVFMSKRKVFDTQKMRIQNTEAAKFVAQGTRRNARASTGGGAAAAASRAPAVPAASKRQAPAAADERQLGGKSKDAKWRQQSEQFRNAIRQARMYQQAQAKGTPLSALPPPVPSAPDPSLIPCPHCGRRFNEAAAERHIPKCKDIKAKPSRLTRGSGINAANGRQATEVKKGYRR